MTPEEKLRSTVDALASTNVVLARRIEGAEMLLAEAERLVATMLIVGRVPLTVATRRELSDWLAWHTGFRP